MANAIDRLKNLEVGREDLDSLVGLYASAGVLKASYEANKLPVPEWLARAILSLETEIKRVRTDYVTRRKQQIAQRRRQLRDKQEELADLEKEEASLDQILSEI